MSVRIMTVFGIRPDFIRASSIIKKLKARDDAELCFVYTGQHYDKQLKSIFFEELGIPEPDITLDARGDTHAQQHARLIEQLEKPIDDSFPNQIDFIVLVIAIEHVGNAVNDYTVSFFWHRPVE